MDRQRAIADFLDKKTAAIDALIAKKERLIELLQEKRQALITQAVTREDALGRPPPRRRASEWYTEVPEGWVRTRLKFVVRQVADGPHFSPPYVEPGEGKLFISARNVKVDSWSLDDAKYIDDALFEEFSRRVRPVRGDVLYTKGGTTGIA